MSKHDTIVLNRRGFFARLAGVFGAVGTAVALRPQAGTDAEPVADPPAAEKRGYHVTEHIRTYYRKARF